VFCNFCNKKSIHLAHSHQGKVFWYLHELNSMSSIEGKMEGVDMRVSRRSLNTEMTDANIHELMDETRQLLERIEFKDHPMSFHNKVHKRHNWCLLLFHHLSIDVYRRRLKNNVGNKKRPYRLHINRAHGCSYRTNCVYWKSEVP